MIRLNTFFCDCFNTAIFIRLNDVVNELVKVFTTGKFVRLWCEALALISILKTSSLVITERRARARLRLVVNCDVKTRLSLGSTYYNSLLNNIEIGKRLCACDTSFHTSIFMFTSMTTT